MLNLYMIAAAVTTIQVAVGLPVQALKIYQNRSSSDISRPALLLQVCGYSSWACAALFTDSNAFVLIPNGLGGLLGAGLFVLATVYRDGGDRADDAGGEVDPDSR